MFRLFRCFAFFFVSVVASAQNTQPSPSLAPSSLPTDPAAFLSLVAEMNGLGVSSLPPWPVKATFQILDSDGKVKESGTFEEFHGSGLRDKVFYASPSFTRTIWMNEKGSFATSDPKWPADLEWMVRRSIFDVTPEPRANHAYSNLLWRDASPEAKAGCIVMVSMSAPPELERKWRASYCFN